MTSLSKPSRSPGAWIVAVCFGVLALGFLYRVFDYGYKWLTNAPGDANYKVMTIWCVIYLLVCGAIAYVTYRVGIRAGSAETQNGERGT